MKKVISLIMSFTVLLYCMALFSACGTINDSDTVIVVDMEGTKVAVPKNISRVACISPSATDLMIAFGLGDKIVGTYRSFLYNPWVTEIYPEAENYKGYSYSVSAEELVADGIELVILQDTENAEAFRNAGIPVIAVHQYSPSGRFDSELYETARIIGEIFKGSAKEKADAWCNEVKEAVSEIRSSIAANNGEKPVYYVNGEKQKGLYYSDGGNSMISFILNTANTALATEKYEVLNVHKVSDEEMVSLNPYAMLIGGIYQNDLVNELNESEIWSALECNKQNRIYRIPVAMVGIENISAETPVMLKYAAGLFNDGYEYDLIAGLRENIKKYFGYDLSKKDAENMLCGLDKNGEITINE